MEGEKGRGRRVLRELECPETASTQEVSSQSLSDRPVMSQADTSGHWQISIRLKIDPFRKFLLPLPRNSSRSSALPHLTRSMLRPTKLLLINLHQPHHSHPLLPIRPAQERPLPLQIVLSYLTPTLTRHHHPHLARSVHPQLQQLETECRY